jgi:hypothetical protein
VVYCRLTERGENEKMTLSLRLLTLTLGPAGVDPMQPSLVASDVETGIPK